MRHILPDQPITFAEATKVFPSRPHVNTVRRWAFQGINGVKLRHFKCGNRPCTTHVDIEEFLAATNPNYRADRPVVSSQHEAAEAALDKMGV